MSKYNCEHGKRKYTCKDCNGSAICVHGKDKYRCIDCGGIGVCEHKKDKRTCIDCNGSAICEHKKRKTLCIECGGSQICEHKKRKSRCKECGGQDLCEHDKDKFTCIECGGSQICEHKKRKILCIDCDGQGLCEHKKDKMYCKDCNGSQVCEHKKRKTLCIECGGSQICEHKKRKSKCKECGGSEICKHRKYKSTCKECGGSALCKTSFCETRGIPKYNGYCLPCCIQLFPEIEVSRNYKTKEKDVSDRVDYRFPKSNFTWIDDKIIKDGCSLRRPDKLLDMGSHIIIIETDENKHSDYDCSCEHKRIMEISKDLHHRPIVFIRFNPDDYINEDGILIKSCWKLNKKGVLQIADNKKKEWEERIECLIQQIQYWIDNPTEKTIEVIELFY